MAGLLRILNAHLGSHAYVGGDSLTMGDIALGCPAWRWFAMPMERPALPHLQRWFEALASRAAYRRTVMLPLS
jgi:glutathione S-transferase